LGLNYKCSSFKSVNIGVPPAIATASACLAPNKPQAPDHNLVNQPAPAAPTSGIGSDAPFTAIEELQKNIHIQVNRLHLDQCNGQHSSQYLFQTGL